MSYPKIPMNNKHLVVSAVNLVEGGTLEILRQCLREAVKSLNSDWRVTAIVHSEALVGVPGIKYLERPEIKSSWFKRIRFEYFECKRISAELKPDFWLSLHDMTPSLGSAQDVVPQAVYCHNAMCFYSMPLREMWLEPKLILFNKLYALFYRLNIQRNSAVIVQQDWIRQTFQKHFECSKVIVAHPLPSNMSSVAKIRSGRRFFYPSFPRAFKNFETVLAAWEILCRDAMWDGVLTLTIDGTVNRYCRQLHRRFGHLRQVNFVGKLSHVEVCDLYTQNDCLVFASKLETWGLPISEAKQAGLSILVSDLPYAHEAVGKYDGVAFFPPADAVTLAQLMREFRYKQMCKVEAKPPKVVEPFVANWSSLLQQLLSVTNVPGTKSLN